MENDLNINDIYEDSEEENEEEKIEVLPHKTVGLVLFYFLKYHYFLI